MIYLDEYWDVDAHCKTPRTAAQEFADTYFQEPRKVCKTFRPCGRGGLLFRLRNGDRAYWLRLVDNSPPVWRISIYTYDEHDKNRRYESRTANGKAPDAQASGPQGSPAPGGDEDGP